MWLPNVVLRNGRRISGSQCSDINTISGNSTTSDICEICNWFLVEKIKEIRRKFIIITGSLFVRGYHRYVTIIYLPLISDFSYSIQILFGSSDEWQLKRSQILYVSRLLNLTESLRACTLTFFTQLGEIHIISLSYFVYSKWGCTKGYQKVCRLSL